MTIFNILVKLSNIMRLALLQMSLDKVGKEKYEFRDLNSQRKHLKYDPKVSLCVLKDSRISSSQKIQTAENHTQMLLLWLAQLQSEVRSQPSRVFPVKVRTLRRNGILKVGLETCGKTLMELGTLSPQILMSLLYQWKRFVCLLPAGAASPPLSEGINPALSEGTVVASPEAEIVQDDTASPPPHHPFF